MMNPTSKITHTKMILMIILICIILTGFRMLWLTFHTVPEHPLAMRGVLDLRDWSAGASRPITLEGEWEFYPEQWLTPADFANLTASVDRIYLKVPGKWDAAKGGAAYGYGTYRLVVKTSEDPETMYGIRVKNVISASEIYVNGHLLASNGQSAASRELHQARNTPYSVYFKEKGNQIELIMHVSNYEYSRGGGIVGSLKFGTADAIERESLFYITTNLIAVIVLFLYGFCSFILYLFRNKDRMLLYFSLLLFSAASSILTNYEKLLLIWLPLDFEWSMKVRYLAYCGIAMFVTLFLKHLFPQYGKAKFIPWFCTLSGIVALLSVLSPSSYVVLIEPLSLLLNAVGACIVPTFYIREAWKRNEGAFYMLLGGIGTFSHAVWSYLDNKGLFEAAYYPFDIIISFFSLALFWSVKFFRATENTKRLAEVLQQADRNKDEFLAMTSHELRNPLHGMINIAQTVIDSARPELGNQNAKHMELLINVGRHMSFMLNDLLDLNNLRENRLKIQTGSVQLQSVAAGVLDMLRFMTENKPIRLVQDIPDTFPNVHADENRLIQILFNLVHNAVKYTNQGTVAITAEIDDGKANIHIEDTGIGMNEELQQRIFQPYEQGDSSITSIGGGLGLGLSICKRLAELLNGSLQVKSVPGEGTVFTLTLPLFSPFDQQLAIVRNNTSVAYWESAAAASDLTKDAYEKNPVPAGNRPRILAVDDDPVNLKILDHILSADQYDVVVTTSGNDALSKLDKQEWDLIITDVMMPQMSGYELATMIRERFSVAELPIILLTARSRPEDMYAGFRAGANDYVTKPMDALELKARVRALTNTRQAMAERLRMEAAWLQAQIKPHFLFNTLNAIAALSEIDMREMHRLLTTFGDYLRISFDFKNSEHIVPLHYELELVRSYLHIEKVRFEDRLQVIWEVDETRPLLIPPLCIQPLVENAVCHGLLKRSQGGFITIKITHYTEYAEISITDNGIGMSEDTLSRLFSPAADKRKGIGVFNTDRRLKQIYGTGLLIKSTPNEGTTVSFRVPNTAEMTLKPT
ncbi:hybrid sensor histidine kinase/response regulator [Paenibacillus sedimenti]|uniref:Circadian input-output histidine kinase CikA n=1 Tax=Paenibacillus sedimenti TaxID=2770274 RepID=A0A926KUW9_9BACL|nr:ATP-binding protein [Paenibacillus sedimenti]MBD0383611.1 response regulator [Paenibacillus sedimenti]